MQTCMHMYHTWTITVCTRPGLSSCWSLFWKVEVGACLDFMEWCKFHLLRAFLGFAGTTSCNMMWVGGNIFSSPLDSMNWMDIGYWWVKDEIMLTYKLLSINCWCSEWSAWPAAIWCGWEVISFGMNTMMQLCLIFSVLKTKRSWSFIWFQNDVSRRKVHNKVAVSFESCLSSKIINIVLDLVFSLLKMH